MSDQHLNNTDDMDKRFTDRLRILVETMIGPQGKPYTSKEISDGTGLAPHYVRSLLRGEVAMPSAERVQRLAAFFGVDASYFTGGDSLGKRSEAEVDTALLRQLSDPWMLQIARRSVGMGRVQKELLLDLIDTTFKHLSGIDTAAQRDDDEPDESPAHEQEQRRSGNRRLGHDRRATSEDKGANKSREETTTE